MGVVTFLQVDLLRQAYQNDKNFNDKCDLRFDINLEILGVLPAKFEVQNALSYD